MVSKIVSVAILLFSSPLLAAAQTCSCYTTSDGASYSKAGMWDFRHQTIPSSIPNPSQTYGSWGSTQPGYLTSAAFNNYWRFEGWTQDGSGTSPVNMQRDPSNAYLEANKDSSTGAAAQLTLRSKQFAGFNSGTEMSFANDIHGQFMYGSFRFRGKITGDAGSTAGFFTFLSNTEECDTEFLSREGVNSVHYTNQPSAIDGVPVAGATTDFDMFTLLGQTKKRGYPPLLRSRQAGEGWNGWKTYRTDWKQGVTSFYINGKKALDKTVNVPTVPSDFLINIWSNGDPSWSGTMVTNAATFLNIEWIEFFWQPTTATGCCMVDADSNSYLNGYPVTNSS